MLFSHVANFFFLSLSSGGCSVAVIPALHHDLISASSLSGFCPGGAGEREDPPHQGSGAGRPDQGRAEGGVLRAERAAAVGAG